MTKIFFTDGTQISLPTNYNIEIRSDFLHVYATKPGTIDYEDVTRVSYWVNTKNVDVIYSHLPEELDETNELTL